MNLHFEPKQENSPVIPCVTFTVTKALKQIPEIQLESAQPRSVRNESLCDSTCHEFIFELFIEDRKSDKITSDRTKSLQS